MSVRRIVCVIVLALAPVAVMAQTLILNVPNGGESWTVGDEHAIHWDWTGSISNVKLEYSTDGGSTWIIIMSSTTNDGNYQWTVPNSPSTTCRIKVTSTTDPGCYDMSNSNLAIARPVILVTRPNGGTGGEIWTVGEEHAIHWDWTGSFGNVKLEYSSDGGSTWNIITSSTTNDGNYQWTVPNSPSITCRVKVTSTTDPACYDASDHDFNIIRPVISVLRPNGGETYYATKVHPIHWDWTGSFSNVKLEYSSDGGNTWNVITSSTTNDGNYSWTVPNITTGSCRVKVSKSDDANTYDISSYNFTVSNTPPSDPIAVNSPRSGDAWLVGRYYYITWTWTGSISYVKLEYSTDGGSTWSLIDANTSNYGYYNWHIPNTPSTTSLIKVSNASNPSIYDVSDQFTIAPQWILTSSPRTGDAWLVGRYYYFTWDNGGDIDYVKLEYSTDGGSTWTLIDGNTSNYGYYNWHVPSAVHAGSNSQMKVTNTANVSVFDMSDIFTISPQAIVVTSPEPGEVWHGNRYYYITWSWTGEFDYAKLEYSTDGGSTWTVIDGNTSNYGYYNWHVPGTASGSNCKVRVSNTANLSAYGVSPAFTINPQTGVAEPSVAPEALSSTAGLYGACLTVAPVRLWLALPTASAVDCAIYNSAGALVKRLVGSRYDQGVHALDWDGRDAAGVAAPSGIYCCVVRADGATISKRIALLGH